MTGSSLWPGQAVAHRKKDNRNHRAARLVNKEVLALYYAIGGYISVQSRAARWGSNAIGTISELLQQELPGLRGFSETSIKRMRIFYEAWCSMFENRPLSADDLQNCIIPVGDKGHVTSITQE